MIRDFFSQFGGRQFKKSGRHPRRGSRRQNRKSFRAPFVGAWADLSLERLESRVVLSADPVLTVVADQVVDEGAVLSITNLGTFTDVVEGSGSGGATIGLNPTVFTSLGTFASASENIVIDTSGLAPTFTGGGVSGGLATIVTADIGFGSFEIAVFTFSDFTLDASSTITATGSRPLVLLSQNDLTIAGIIDVSAKLDPSLPISSYHGEQMAGPGGGDGGLGADVNEGDPAPTVALPGEQAAGAPANSVGKPLIDALLIGGGGTGAGFGGNGGNAQGPGMTAGTRASYGDLEVAIQGGSGGGTAGGAGFSGSSPVLLAGGGGGGGGIELGASGTLQISASGQVLADGGDAANALFIPSAGGGGGGAGGGILLHATNVNQFGTLSANGGKGGAALHSGGGGGGGKITIVFGSGTFDGTGGTETTLGGAKGGGTATPGAVGDAPLPFSDPGGSTPVIEAFDFVINWGDLSMANTGMATIDMAGVDIDDPVAGSFDGNHTYDDDGIYVVTVTVNDDNGGTDTETFMVTVDNVAPTLDTLVITSAVSEGGTATLSGTYSDAGTLDTHELDIDWDGDNVYDETVAVTSGSFSLDHVYADDDPSGTLSDLVTVNVRLRDDDNDSDTDSESLTVNNVDPTIGVVSAAVTVDETQTAVNTGTFADVPADTVTLSASLGTVVDDGGGKWSWSFDSTDDLGPVPVTITATDDDGGVASVMFDLTVDNVAPTADAGGPYLTFDDVAITLAGSGFDVAGAADPLTFEWDLDGDNIFETNGANATFDPEALGITATTTVTIALRVSDDDGGVSVVDTADVTVIGTGTTLIDGALYIVGDKIEGDHVFVKQRNGLVKVYASFNDDNPVVFDAVDVDDIYIRARGGNDRIILSHSVYIGTTIDGGAGDDALLGGSGDDLILGGEGNDMLAGQRGNDMLLAGGGMDDLFGGSGDDVLVAGDDDDLLFGGSGRDLLIGGQGGDFLYGGRDDDILIGGITIHDDDVGALDEVMAVWTSSDSFDDRVAELTGTSGLLEAGVAVLDDGESDVLIGGPGRDLLFADITFEDLDVDFIVLNHRFDHLEVVD